MRKDKKRPKLGGSFEMRSSSLFSLQNLKKNARLLVPSVGISLGLMSQSALSAPLALKMNDVITLGGFAGAISFAAVLAFMYRRQMQKWAQDKNEMELKLNHLKLQLQDQNMVLSAQDQVVVSYDNNTQNFFVRGNAPQITHLNEGARLLDFGAWMSKDAAEILSAHLDALVESGTLFSHNFLNAKGEWIFAEGKTVQGRVLVVFKKLDSYSASSLENSQQFSALSERIARMEAFADALDEPVWMRDELGKLTYCNRAYAQLCGMEEPTEVIAGQKEILKADVKDALLNGRKISHGCVRLIGQMNLESATGLYEFCEWGTPTGSVGLAKAIRTLNHDDLSQKAPLFKEALNLISTGVAIFDAKGLLLDCNDRFLTLWGLARSFVREKPDFETLMDHLRILGKLPEQTDFRSWKAKLTSAIGSKEIYQDNWHLPDGRTLLNRLHPENDGYFSFLSDDISEQHNLESQYNALNLAQGETLHALSEGVCVIGSNGKLRLYNPAFAKLWQLDEADMQNKPHIETLIKKASLTCPSTDVWQSVLGVCVGTAEARKPYRQRMLLNNGVGVDVSASPLPDGSTLITLIDVTDSVNAETLLIEHNEALERAAKIKSDFVHHISYVLRSPLTNIIGFAELLDSDQTGQLSEKQQSYANYILSSSASLLAIINDILDLASIDEGALALNVQKVSIVETIEEAISGLGDSLEKAGVSLNLSLASSLSSVYVDQKRLRQVLFNLLSNAVSFSEKGKTIFLTVENGQDGWQLVVEDQGCGIPKEVIDRVFERFESHSGEQKNKGLGLGLTLVRAFVELHGGHVDIQSEPNMGTRVVCHWPHNVPQVGAHSKVA